MHVALISPLALLNRYASRTNYHLVLPHLLDSKKYSVFYREMQLRGDYVILDNGAAEGTLYGPRYLHTLAKKIQAHEIVVPDTLGDTQATIGQYLGFTPYAQPEYKYMAVIQGQNFSEVQRCLALIDTNPSLMYITTIGIPRILNKIKPNFRVMLTEWLINEHFHDRFEFHYLGATPEWSTEVGILAEYPLGRGLDTSKPIYMGLLGLDINFDKDPGRPENYFHVTHDAPKIEHNVASFLTWAGYDDPSSVG